MIPEALLTHFTGERVRLRIPAREEDTEFFETVQRDLQEVEGVRRVSVDALTGGVLLWHEGTIGQLADRLEERELFRISTPDDNYLHAQSGILTDLVADRLRRFDRRVIQFTNGSLDARGLVFLVLLAGGIYQLSRRKIWPSGVTLFKYAFESLFP